MQNETNSTVVQEQFLSSTVLRVIFIFPLSVGFIGNFILLCYGITKRNAIKETQGTLFLCLVSIADLSITFSSLLSILFSFVTFGSVKALLCLIALVLVQVSYGFKHSSLFFLCLLRYLAITSNKDIRKNYKLKYILGALLAGHIIYGVTYLILTIDHGDLHECVPKGSFILETIRGFYVLAETGFSIYFISKSAFTLRKKKRNDINNSITTEDNTLRKQQQLHLQNIRKAFKKLCVYFIVFVIFRGPDVVRRALVPLVSFVEFDGVILRALQFIAILEIVVNLILNVGNLKDLKIGVQ